MKNVLISGASFAGLATAYWMNRSGYQVTIVEINQSIKKGGTPVNILEGTIDVVKRMGLFEQIAANQIRMERMEFKNALDETERSEAHKKNEEYEIERDVLLDMMYNAVKNNVEIIYGDSITSLTENNNGIDVTFRSNPSRTFDLVFGCDGIHSIVRKLWFGPETEFSRFLNIYFSISIVHKLLIPEYTTQMYSEPGRTVMLNAYNGKTDICFAYHSENEVSYDYRNDVQMRQMICDAFQRTGWRTPELLKEVAASETFYFDKLCQLKMPNWTKGRVALVGDAGYCASPAAGRGGSLAIDGAAALADAFEQSDDDYQKAFKSYNTGFRPFVEQLQEDVVSYNLDALVPKDNEAIRKRNKEGFGF
ncbi:FAD-dependent monooxygenase [Taibaiella soli]|uniref:FAD-binding monooxygenase n=1 Tax=Taibaiella soli TaxID=1649169 RepID=A0A2W2AT15_9BACT|nr:FAD-dependent monooxygenase [Taibaiella soli]PZF70838.1 FAD-binding monooxygenase [Taibaiella soli]